jgi:hypothetical protein
MKRSSVSSVIVAAAIGLSACAQFEGAASEELAEHTGTAVERLADGTGRTTNDYDVLARALHEVVDLDDAGSDRLRPRYTGLEDDDGDGLDDDGRVEIIVRNQSSCLTVTGNSAHAERGPC